MRTLAFDIQKMLDDPEPPKFEASEHETQEAARIAASAVANGETAVIPNPAEVSLLYALAVSLGELTSAQNFDQIAKYLTRMDEAELPEFAILALKLASKKHNNTDADFTRSEAYVQLCMGHLGELIAGVD